MGDMTGDSLENRRRILRWVFGLLAVAATLGPTWWWALNGMSADVGIAWIVTAMLLGLGCFCTVVPDL